MSCADSYLMLIHDEFLKPVLLSKIEAELRKNVEGIKTLGGVYYDDTEKKIAIEKSEKLLECFNKVLGKPVGSLEYMHAFREFQMAQNTTPVMEIELSPALGPIFVRLTDIAVAVAKILETAEYMPLANAVQLIGWIPDFRRENFQNSGDSKKEEDSLKEATDLLIDCDNEIFEVYNSNTIAKKYESVPKFREKLAADFEKLKESTKMMVRKIPAFEKLKVCLDNVSKDGNKMVLVLVKRIDLAVILHHYFKNDGWNCRIMTSNSTANYRNEIIRHLKEGKSNLLFATYVAKEGLDLPNLDLVVRYAYDHEGAIDQQQSVGRLRTTGETISIVAPGIQDKSPQNEVYLKMMDQAVHKIKSGKTEAIQSTLCEHQRALFINPMIEKELKIEEVEIDEEFESAKIICGMCKQQCLVENMYSKLKSLDCHKVLLLSEIQCKYKREKKVVKRNVFSEGCTLTDYKIHCASTDCNKEWGRIYRTNDGREALAVGIKFVCFILGDDDNEIRTFKKWNQVTNIETIGSI